MITFYKRKKAQRRPATKNTEPSLTDASQAKATDVNYIMSQYLKTGDKRLLEKRAGQYADLSQIGDLSEALMQIQIANEAFMDLPAQLRARLNNDPVLFIDYLNDPANKEEATKLGFFKALPEVSVDPSMANPDTKKPTKKAKQPDLSIDEE